jgi:hypothetical protein
VKGFVKNRVCVKGIFEIIFLMSILRGIIVANSNLLLVIF